MTVLDINDVETKPICKTGSKGIFPVLGIFYMVSLILVLMIWPFMGIDFALTVGITIFTGCVLAIAVWVDSRKGRWSLIVVEKSVPVILWLFFGIGAIVAMSRPEDMRYYGAYEDSTVLLMAIYAFLGAVSYMIGFRLIYKPPTQNKPKNEYSRVSVRLAILLVVILLFIDWYMNLKLISSGLFFNWIAKIAFDTSVRGTDILYHVQKTTTYLITPILLYLISVSRHKKLHILFYMGLIILHTILIILKGDRSDLIYAGIVFVLSSALLFHLKISIKRAIQLIVLAVLFFGILSPVIQESRFLMRLDSESMVEDPISIPILYITKYLPKAFSLEYILGNPSSSQRRFGFFGRMGSYMSYAVSMYQANLNGVSLRPLSELKTTLQTMIPRFLYAQKSTFDADALLLRHFGIGVPGQDSNGTPLADVFSFLHIYGVIGLFAIMGVGFGFVTKHLKNNYGLIGEIIVIGLFPVLLPLGDSFVGYLADLRNVMIFIGVVMVVSRFNGVLDQDVQVSPVTRRAG